MSVSNTNTGLTITDNGIAIPDTSTVRQEVAGDYRGIWGQDLDISPYTPQGQMIDTETAIIDDKNAQLMFVLNQFDPEKNQGIWQEGVGKIYFITRHPARPTTVICQVIGAVGTVIPGGSLAQSDDNVLYQTQYDFAITTPSPMNLQFTCTVPGPVPCPANSITRIFSQVPGWDTINNTDAGITGTNEETRIAFERRRYESVAKNAHGNVDSVRGAVADVTGVISVQIAENKTGWDSNSPEFISRYGTPWPGIIVHNHSMFISVAGGNNLEIAEEIWNRIDGGCGQDGNTSVVFNVPTLAGHDTLQETVTFNRPNAVQGYVQVTIKEFTNTPGDIDDQIRRAVVDAWNGISEEFRVEIGDTVYGLRFACPLNKLGGFNLLTILVARGSPTGFSASFNTTLNEFATISAGNVSVVHA